MTTELPALSGAFASSKPRRTETFAGDFAGTTPRRTDTFHAGVRRSITTPVRPNQSADSSADGGNVKRGMTTSVLTSIGGLIPRSEVFQTRVIVMVDEATEPSITDTEAQDRVERLVALANAKGRGFYSGSKVAYAVRKRLKCEDEAAIMNSLLLLDELMRSVPYFFWHVGEPKMWRRLWRFVVPGYKYGLRHRTKGILTKTNVGPGYRPANPAIVNKVLTLIRAWAEDLSVIYNGRSGKIDPAASFIIEHYRSKQRSIRFPTPPNSDLPWICPVGRNAFKNAENVYAVRRASNADEDGLPTRRFSVV